jgi:chromosome partitioning protein
MPVIVVANPKGGVGKTTLSTNIAGWFASRGHAVMLGDVDRQQSSLTWLGLRPPQLPRIGTWETSYGDIVRPPKGTTHVVLDTPAGLHGKRLDEVMKLADKVLIPLTPGIFDIHATHAFVRQLHQHHRADKVRLGVVAMRVREGTISAEQLHEYLAVLGVPVVASLRDTQHYVQLAAHGLTLWDVPPGRHERDLEQWQPLLDWLTA